MNKKKGDAEGMIVLFGSTGDLTKKKLIPALYKLYSEGKIGIKNPIICVGRRDITNDEYIDLMKIKEINGENINDFIKMIYYIRVDLDEPDINAFDSEINKICNNHNCISNRMFYLSTPSSLFQKIINFIKATKITKKKGWTRVVFEKPFGDDLESSKKLNKVVKKAFDDKEIYRIDHYLGKDLIQNIITFRFANPMFESIWDNKHIDHIQITVSEKSGADQRMSYYDKSGAVKDMLQNHIMQIASLIMMEKPISLSPKDINKKKVEILKSLKKPLASEISLGQYKTGIIDKGKVKGYTEEDESVSDSIESRPPVKHTGGKLDSNTETFVSVKTNSNIDRWKGVPIYMRTGKRMKEKYAEVDVVFKENAYDVFTCPESNKYILGGKCNPAKNVISFRIQPDEGIAIRFNTKTNESLMRIKPAVLNYCHNCQYGFNTPDAYEVMLYNVMLGDKTLFTSEKFIEEGWKFVDKIEKMKSSGKVSIEKYKAGKDGPESSDEIINKDKRHWIGKDELRQD